MSVKSLVKIEGYFYAIFTAKTRQKPQPTSIISAVKSPATWSKIYIDFYWPSIRWLLPFITITASWFSGKALRPAASMRLIYSLVVSRCSGTSA